MPPNKTVDQINGFFRGIQPLRPESPPSQADNLRKFSERQSANFMGGQGLVTAERGVYESTVPRGLTTNATALGAGPVAAYPLLTSGAAIPTQKAFYIDGCNISWQLYNPAGLLDANPINIFAFIIADQNVVHCEIAANMILPPAAAMGDNYNVDLPPILALPNTRLQLFMALQITGGNVGGIYLAHFAAFGKMVDVTPDMGQGNNRFYPAAAAGAALLAELQGKWAL